MPFKDPEKEKQWRTAYRARTAEHRRAQKAVYYQRTREQTIAARSEYRHAHKKEQATLTKIWRAKNRQKIKEDKARKYREDLEASRTASRKRSAEYRKRCAEKKRASQLSYCKRQRAISPLFRLRDNCRRRVRKVLLKAGVTKSERTHELLGCSPAFYKEFIEARLLPGMTWENYGTYWVVDHKQPLVRFNLLDRTERLAAFHYTNTQPLTVVENNRKGART